jgi:beta-phosphoglucomutase-like phosphatase (HAD superfamily)
MEQHLIVTIEALIFDCDGTLCDSMPAHYAAWTKVLEPVGMTLERERYLSFAGTPSQRVIPMLAEEQGITLPDFPSLNRAKEDSFLDVAHLLQPIEAVVSVARENRGKLKMAVASGGVRRLVMRQLEQLEIVDWFETIVTAEDTERHKPDPDVFLEAARRLGVAPERCRVYEDGEPGIEAARRAGMECVDIRPWL